MPGTGLLAATVPGSFGAWTLLVQRWGTWSLADILDYAIGYCERGYPALPAIRSTVSRVAGMFTEHWATSAAAWLHGGAVPDIGAVLTNAVLGRTYQRIVAEASARTADREQQFEAARDIFYRGWVTEQIDRFCSTTSWLDTSGRTNAGLLTADDMAAWEPTVEQPSAFDYGRYQVLKTDLWGQGPVFGQQLALLDGLGLDEAGYGSPDYLHALIEAGKLAFADREAWYGDSATVSLDALLDPEYTAQRRALIGAEASLELRPGSPGGRAPRLPDAPGPADLAMLARSLIAGAGEPTLRANGQVAGDTCHLDVVDAAGNMVSATPSGGWLQSSPMIPELGFALGTRAQMFWLDEGLPNSLRPGVRPRTTLSPSMALRDGEPWPAFGTPGGDQQDQWSLHFFLAMVHGGLGMQEAIEAPALHSEHFPSSFYPRGSRPGHVVLEERFPAPARDELSRRGHRVDIAGPWALGRLSAVAREPDHLAAAANPRGAQGYAVGR